MPDWLSTELITAIVGVITGLAGLLTAIAAVIKAVRSDQTVAGLKALLDEVQQERDHDKAEIGRLNLRVQHLEEQNHVKDVQISALIAQRIELEERLSRRAVRRVKGELRGESAD